MNSHFTSLLRCVLAASLPPTTALAVQLGNPLLVDEVVLTSDAQSDHTPAISFSRSHGHGVVLFGKRLDEGCGPLYDDMYAAHWTTSAGWAMPEFVTGQQVNGRHSRFGIAFEPNLDTFLTTFNSTEASSPCADGVDSRLWAGAWDAGPFRLSDGVDDDDANGGLRFASDGSYAIAVWVDQAGVGILGSGIAGRVWDASQQIWRPTQGIQPATGSQPVNLMREHHSIDQDPSSSGWIVAYQKRSVGALVLSPNSADVAYRVGSASPTSFVFGPEVKLTDDLGSPVFDGQPIVSFQPSGTGAVFFHRSVGGGDLELMASLWNPVSMTFNSPMQLTADAEDQQLAAVVPGAGGWHVIFLAIPPGTSAPAIYHSWFDGVALSTAVRLTFGGHAAGLYFESGVDGATNADGRTFLTWEEWDGISENTREIHVAELAFELGTPFCFGDGTGSVLCPCDPGQSGGPGEGCANSTGTGGILSAFGAADVSSDTLNLHVEGLPPVVSALFFQGVSKQNGGNGAPFGDGLLCVTGSIIRLGTHISSGGILDFGANHPGDPLISVRGMIPSAGGMRHYQVWYRNAAAFCTSSVFNLSQGLTIQWQP